MADSDERATYFYQENAKLIETFLDWRYRVMTSWFAVTSATFAIAGWVYTKPELKKYTFVAFGLGCAYSLMSAMFDLRTARILQEGYRIGGELEQELFRAKGLYHFVGESHKHRRVTYTRILRVAYFGSSMFFLWLAIRVWLLVKRG